MSTEPVDAEVVESGQEVAVQSPAAVAMFRTDDPLEIMERTAEIATAMKRFVSQQGLTVQIKGRTYIEVEGWQMLGMMLGVAPVVKATHPVDGGWEAIVELHDRTGRVVGAGEAECLTSEKDWKTRDDYARRSMAQTRAIGKAYRNTFGFIAKAAGYEVLPAEEADGQPAEAPALPAHAAGEEAAQVNRENGALIDELVNTHGLREKKAEELFDGHRTLEQKRELTVKLGRLIEQRQAAK